jgi:hypothetical protein
MRVKLAEWLQAEKTTQAEFARDLGVASSFPHKWCHGVLPSRKHMRAIVRRTRGLVGPADFYDLPQVGEVEAVNAGARDIGLMTNEERRIRAIRYLEEELQYFRDLRERS